MRKRVVIISLATAVLLLIVLAVVGAVQRDDGCSFTREDFRDEQWQQEIGFTDAEYDDYLDEWVKLACSVEETQP